MGLNHTFFHSATIFLFQRKLLFLPLRTDYTVSDERNLIFNLSLFISFTFINTYMKCSNPEQKLWFGDHQCKNLI